MEIQLKKYAKIFTGIKTKDIMTKNVITLTRNKKVSHAKEMMRIKKISGIPIVDEKKYVIGIISIEDIIYALEENKINYPLKDVMTKEVVTLNENDKILEIIEKFDKFRYGRFPVINDEKKLVGIISRNDIVHGILEKFELMFLHNKERNDKLNIDNEKLDTILNFNPETADFKYEIISHDVVNAGIGAALLKKFLIEKGINSELARKVSIATYEAETNVIIHSKSNGFIYCHLQDDVIIVRIVDYGIGIDDIDKAMQEGYSTAPEYVREYGFGAGMGLSNMKRYTDKMVILSEKNVGTTVELIYYYK